MATAQFASALTKLKILEAPKNFVEGSWFIKWAEVRFKY